MTDIVSLAAYHERLAEELHEIAHRITERANDPATPKDEVQGLINDTVVINRAAFELTRKR